MQQENPDALAKTSQLESRKEILLTQPHVVNTNWLRTLNPLVKNVEGKLVWSAALQQGIVEFINLPKIDKDQYYQLWVHDLVETSDQASLVAVFKGSKDEKLVMAFDTIKVKSPYKFELVLHTEGKTDNQAQLDQKQTQLALLKPDCDPIERANLQHEIAEIMLDSGGNGMPEAAWGLAKESFLIYMKHEQFEDAVNALDALYRTDLPGSVVALGHAMWLSVTYPIDPELSIVMMKNLVDDTPDKSDGAAVAAATAHYIADLRLEGEKRDSVMFLTTNLLAKVAERHSNVTDQGQLNFWMDKLEINDPNLFLPKLAQVIDAIVAGDWWFDRDELRANLPLLLMLLLVMTKHVKVPTWQNRNSTLPIISAELKRAKLNDMLTLRIDIAELMRCMYIFTLCYMAANLAKAKTACIIHQ
ncbi:hypothetical protein GQR58_025973 [Nymphon striatum]|nr:hypothetical protein GQR58_025973 [Nymphon striatum]